MGFPHRNVTFHLTFAFNNEKNELFMRIKRGGQKKIIFDVWIAILH